MILILIALQPFEKSTWDSFGSIASTLEGKYTISKSEYQNLNFKTWGNEAFELSKKYAWEGIVESQPVTEEYIKSRLPIVERQIVLGGKRLAYVIE